MLHWQGGDHAQVEFPELQTGQHRSATDHDLVETVHKLARIQSDTRIASILNKNQRRTAHGQIWTSVRACSMRNHHAIPVHGEGERQARGEMSVREVADILGVTLTAIFLLIHLKQLLATQECVNAPWAMFKSDVELYSAEENQNNIPLPGDSTALLFENR